MYKRNLKYIKGRGNVEKWEIIPDNVAKKLLEYFERYAEEKGFDVTSYMEFIKQSVIVKEN